MGSKRYWTAIGVLAAFVGLVVFVSTSPVQDQAAVSSPTSTAPAQPASTTTTTTTTQPEATTTTMQPPATTATTLPLPMTGGGPDWLGAYFPLPEVLTGQVVDVDDDGEPDIALFGSAESPMIYPIDDGGDPIEPVAGAQELVAASERIAELESDISALEQITQELTEQVAAGDNAPVPQSATPTGTSPAPAVDAEGPTTTPKDPEDDSESSGLTSAQQSLLLALISTAGIVLAGLGAPVMTAWARRRFGGPGD